jgi:O-antigen ligase/predicted negative regulator of RcsB-dependent stress response
MIGPLILGAARLWIELPLLCVGAGLLLVQGLRLTTKPAAEALRRMDAIDISVVLFVLYTLARWLTSPAEFVSRIEAMDVVAYAVVFLACRYGMPNRQYCMVLLYLLVGLGVIETGIGFYMVNHLDWFPFGIGEKLGLYYAPRWIGTYGSPNHYASLLVMAIGAALALGSFSKLAWPVRIVLFYLAFTMIVGLLFSGSRGGWIAFLASVIALVVVGVRNGTMRWWIPVSAAAVLLVVTGLLFTQSPVAQERLTDPSNPIFGGKLDTNMRVQLARDAVRIARDHPFFGTGPGTFTFVHPRYQDSAFRMKAEFAHDDYLNCVDDYGLVGLGIALFFIASVTFKFFSPLDVDNRWHDRVMVAAGFAAWAALLAHSCVDFNLHIPANALLLFALTGLALGRFKEEKASHWSTISLLPLGGWLGGGLICVALLFGAEVARTTLGDLVYERALAQQDLVPYSESISRAEQALEYDSGNVQALAWLGELHLDQVPFRKSNEDQISEALKALEPYEKAAKANSLDDTLQARIGMALDQMGKTKEALPHFQQAVAAQPFNAQLWYWLGQHYQKAGDSEEAKGAFQHAEDYSRVPPKTAPIPVAPIQPAPDVIEVDAPAPSASLPQSPPLQVQETPSSR